MEGMRRIAYGIVEADNRDELVERVTAMIGRGFVPQGGPFAASASGIIGSMKFYQAMMLVQEVPAVGSGGPQGIVPSA